MDIGFTEQRGEQWVLQAETRNVQMHGCLRGGGVSGERPRFGEDALGQ